MRVWELQCQVDATMWLPVLLVQSILPKVPIGTTTKGARHPTKSVRTSFPINRPLPPQLMGRKDGPRECNSSRVVKQAPFPGFARTAPLATRKTRQAWPLQTVLERLLWSHCRTVAALSRRRGVRGAMPKNTQSGFASVGYRCSIQVWKERASRLQGTESSVGDCGSRF